MNILIGLPCYGGMVQAETMLSMIGLHRLLSLKRIEHTIAATGNESLITRVQNYFANLAVFETDSKGRPFTHLLFIDADSRFSATDILKMIEANKPIIALPYAMKEVQWSTVGQAARLGIPDGLLEHYVGEPNINGTFVPVDEITKIDQVGAGTMLIDTTVFHTMVAKHPDWKYRLYPSEIKQVLGDGGNRDYAFDFFQCGIESQTRLY